MTLLVLNFRAYCRHANRCRVIFRPGICTVTTCKILHDFLFNGPPPQKKSLGVRFERIMAVFFTIMGCPKSFGNFKNLLLKYQNHLKNYAKILDNYKFSCKIFIFPRDVEKNNNL